MTKAIRCFSNVTLLPLPPYSPELNPVEQLWQQIKQRFLSKGITKVAPPIFAVIIPNSKNN
jgi:hypothetical protein